MNIFVDHRCTKDDAQANPTAACANCSWYLEATHAQLHQRHGYAGCRVNPQKQAVWRGLPHMPAKVLAARADVGWADRCRPTCILTDTNKFILLSRILLLIKHQKNKLNYG